VQSLEHSNSTVDAELAALTAAHTALRTEHSAAAAVHVQELQEVTRQAQVTRQADVAKLQSELAAARAGAEQSVSANSALSERVGELESQLAALQASTTAATAELQGELSGVQAQLASAACCACC
jgi:polyhydroxyalkanoate synthesis regulator phasin